MSLQSVLLTGATGNVGAILLEQLLEAGVTVDAVLRSFPKSKAFLEQKYPHAVAKGQLRFTEITDMSDDNVFDKPAKNVSAILHLATPLSSDDFMTKMMEPAWKINQNVLQAADRSHMVKRVIITGSIVAVLQLPQDLAKNATFNEENFNGITREEAVMDQFSAYQYSKVSSEQKSWEFVEKETRSFDLVFLLAPLIIGRSIEQGFKPVKDGMGGISTIYRECFDQNAVGYILPQVMDVDDVARTHVKSLQISAVPGNTRYLLIAGELNAAQLVNKIRAKYPALQSRVPAAKEEEAGPNVGAKFDLSRAEKVFGSNWVSWEDSAAATVADILAYEALYSTGYDL